ncbi:FKBP-type peptidyl-prolyl cis-trans isomerase [Niveispirillum sp. KHB5.9]|uniref:FKBP-type peptidyl-prolyl cis-trans isomerase n=1 Tax=Niveispirillum sp. KHB5.9 TaxID=3400269 RepID=UPI003A8A94EA
MRRRDLMLAACLAALLPAATAHAQALTPAEQAFLAKLGPDWCSVPNGPTRYRIVKSGPATGPQPALNVNATLHYQGRLENGKVFEDTRDAGKPATLMLTRTIPGWKQVLPLMRPGDVWELAVPAASGYGATGSASGKVPPHANLFFTIELLSFVKPKLSSGF